MARQNINVGATGNDKTGDPLRTAFTKTNSNFTELYTSVATITTNMNIPVDYEDILNAPTDISDLTDTTGILIPDPPTSLVNNNKEVELDVAGTLNVPYHTIEAFEITLSAANYVPTIFKPTLTLVGTPWSFNGEFTYSATGGTEFILDDGPLPSSTNPGYANEDAFTFDSTVHGIPNYTLTITLTDVVNVGFVLWTATLTASVLPEYPSTIKSLGAIKLTSNDNDLILGSDGSLILPSGSPILFGNGNARIQSGMGFHINSEEGISIEAVNADDPLNLVTKDWHFGTDGILQLPAGGDIVDSVGVSVLGGGGLSNTYTRVTTPIINAIATNGIIWTALYDTVSSVKLTIQLETDQVGDATGWHSQVCEVIVASRGYANAQPGYGEPIMTVYGVTYTSTVPLVTFTVQRNATTSLIEIVGTRTVATDSTIDFRIHSVEMISRD